jgi:hypothetical protein
MEWLERRLTQPFYDSCVEWPFYKNKKRRGYGYVRRNGKMQIVSRVVCELVYGPSELEASHICNNPSCINPKHLVWSSKEDNLNYRNFSGNLTKGSERPLSKVTEVDVLKIRNSELSCKKLAEIYNCSAPTIHKIKKRKTWKHV